MPSAVWSNVVILQMRKQRSIGEKDCEQLGAQSMGHSTISRFS